MKEILQLDRHRVVTIIGAGGKSTTMYYLAEQMAQTGKRVLVTTTTKIFHKPSDKGRFVVGECWEEWIMRLQDHQTLRDFLVTGTRIRDGKILGVTPEWIDRLQETGLFDLIIVEGDGAARKSMKAPAEHEPVIPESTTLVLPVMGMRVMGKPFTGEIIHRPERFAALTQIHEGDPIGIEHVAEIFCHPQGYNLRAHLPNHEVVPIINQVDSPRQEVCAVKLAEIFVREGMKMVLLTSYRYPTPVRRVCR